jgi:hypothetical protein
MAALSVDSLAQQVSPLTASDQFVRFEYPTPDGPLGSHRWLGESHPVASPSERLRWQFLNEFGNSTDVEREEWLNDRDVPVVIEGSAFTIAQSTQRRTLTLDTQTSLVVSGLYFDPISVIGNGNYRVEQPDPFDRMFLGGNIWTHKPRSEVYFDVRIAGSSTIYKGGSGTLVLPRSNATADGGNGYTGRIFVDHGRLRVTNINALGDGDGQPTTGTTVNDGATLEIRAPNTTSSVSSNERITLLGQGDPVSSPSYEGAPTGSLHMIGGSTRFNKPLVIASGVARVQIDSNAFVEALRGVRSNGTPSRKVRLYGRGTFRHNRLYTQSRVTLSTPAGSGVTLSSFSRDLGVDLIEDIDPITDVAAPIYEFEEVSSSFNGLDPDGNGVSGIDVEDSGVFASGIMTGPQANQVRVNVLGGAAIVEGAITGFGTVVKAGTGGLEVNQLTSIGLLVEQGSLTIRSASAGGKTSTIRSLGFNAAGDASLDLTDGALVIDYTSQSPLQSIRTQIVSGYANGAWTGTGFRSSTAATGSEMARYGVGYVEATLARDLSQGSASFRGVQVDSTALLTAYALYGDCNLTGAVDFADLLIFSANYSPSGSLTSRLWSDGDTNYDGIVNYADLLRFSNNYQTGSTVGWFGEPASGPGLEELYLELYYGAPWILDDARSYPEVWALFAPFEMTGFAETALGNGFKSRLAAAFAAQIPEPTIGLTFLGVSLCAMRRLRRPV